MTPYPTSRAKTPMFAVKFLTYALRSGVSHRFGNDAIAVLTMIATTEDRVRYREAPQFWWSQITDIIKIRRNTLSTLLGDLATAGWLHYEPGDKWTTGRFWVTCPAGDESINASALGETSDGRGILQNGSSRISFDTASVTATDTASVTATDTASVTHSIPIPNPLPPSPKGEAAPLPADADAGSPGELTTQPVEESLTAHQAVVTEWNFCAPVKCSRLTNSRRKVLAARLRDAWWRENWREGLARLPNARFLWGTNDRGWKADFDWFLRPDSLIRLLEGKYDAVNPNGSAATAVASNEAAVNEWLEQRAARERDPEAGRLPHAEGGSDAGAPRRLEFGPG